MWYEAAPAGNGDGDSAGQNGGANGGQSSDTGRVLTLSANMSERDPGRRAGIRPLRLPAHWRSRGTTRRCGSRRSLYTALADIAVADLPDGGGAYRAVPVGPECRATHLAARGRAGW